MSSRVPLLLAAIVGVLGGTLVAGSTLIGASAAAPTALPATSSTTSSPTASTPSDPTCGPKLPAQLRADLKAARKLPVGERRAAVRKIVKAAEAGTYGKRAQQIVERRAQLRKTIRAKLPAQLRADLKKARHLPAGERRPALLKIRKDALAGKYGAKVQTFLEHRKEHRAACRAHRSSASTA